MAEHVLLIVGNFDPVAASRLCAELVSLPDGSRVLLDFRGARRVSTHALGVLVSALASRGGLRVHQCGLARHEERILEYCGIPPVAPNVA